jgi:hypothetical protein
MVLNFPSRFKLENGKAASQEVLNAETYLWMGARLAR